MKTPQPRDNLKRITEALSDERKKLAKVESGIDAANEAIAQAEMVLSVCAYAYETEPEGSREKRDADASVQQAESDFRKAHIALKLKNSAVEQIKTKIAKYE